MDQVKLRKGHGHTVRLRRGDVLENTVLYIDTIKAWMDDSDATRDDDAPISLYVKVSFRDGHDLLERFLGVIVENGFTVEVPPPAKEEARSEVFEILREVESPYLRSQRDE